VKWGATILAMALVAGACSDDDSGAVFTTTTADGAATTTTSTAPPGTTADGTGTTTSSTAAPITTAPIEAGPCVIPIDGVVVHLDFDGFAFEGPLGRPGTEATVAALAADGLTLSQFDHLEWGGPVRPVTETDALIADNPAAVDTVPLGTSSPPNAFRVFDQANLSIAAHHTLPGQMDFIGFNVGFGHFGEGFERPATVELDVEVSLLPFHDIDGTVVSGSWDPVTITLGPGPQPIETCVYLENPGVGHAPFSTWHVDITPRHPDGTPIHLPVGIDDLFYGCFPGDGGSGCATPWTSPATDHIAFAHREFQQDFYGLYVVDPAVPFDEVPLFTRNDDRDLGEPAWSSDGNRIAYVERGDPAGPDAGTRNLYVIGADGSGAVQLTSAGNVFGFDWSPDGSHLVYAIGADDDTADLWIIGADGTSPTPLHDPGDDVGAVEPAWSPDGTTIVFERGERLDGIFWQSELYVIDAAGGAASELVTTPLHEGAINHLHSWSPDSTRIAYSSGFEDGGGVIWVVDVASGTEHSVSNGVSEALSPAWSPVADQIGFFGFSGGTGIWVVDADGSGLSGLPTDPEWGTDLAWSADGTRLAYTGTDPAVEGRAIWVIATDGSPAQRITDLFGSEVDGDWRP